MQDNFDGGLPNVTIPRKVLGRIRSCAPNE
jgi:hypothetical protein